MFERNYSRKQIQQLFNVIDWMIQLPHGLEPAFRQAAYEIEEANNMPYINTFERHGIEKGLLQGREEGRLAEKRETALKLINLGVLTDLQIADITGLSARDVEALRSDNHH